MALKEEFERQGNWLFRWRSYLPLLIFPLLLIALHNSENIEYVYGGDTSENIFEIICIAIAFWGLIIRCITIGYTPIGTSGRNTSGQIADTLNTTGMYSITRHPLYVGNFITIFGITLFVQVWWFSFIIALAFFLYYERIMFAEEEFLRNKFGEPYLKWAEGTPAFWPKFKKWQQPELSFSFKNILKREYPGFFAIIASLTFLKFLGAALSGKVFRLNWGWGIFFFTGLIIYLTLRTLKRKTNFLVVEGR